MKGSLVKNILLWIIMLVAFAGIALDIFNRSRTGDLWYALAAFKYFTLQSNLLIFTYSILSLLIPATANKDVFKFTQRILKYALGPLTSYITLTGLVYLIILEPIYELHGLERVSSVLLHYVTPPSMFLYWLSNEKRKYSLSEVPVWLIYPVLFMVWGLCLALFKGDYLYPFFDTAQYGFYVALYLLFVSIGFASMVALLVFINNYYLKT